MITLSLDIGGTRMKLALLEDGKILFPLYHPAAIIYNRALSETYQQDLMTLKGLLEK